MAGPGLLAHPGVMVHPVGPAAVSASYLQHQRLPPVGLADDLSCAAAAAADGGGGWGDGLH